MEGRTSGEGKGWRGEQVARERDGGENKWREKGVERSTIGRRKRRMGNETEKISDLILTDNPSLVCGCSLRCGCKD